MKRIQEWSALFMAVTLLFTLAAPAALAAESPSAYLPRLVM